jgi:ABC-2 type transport system permease protein
VTSDLTLKRLARIGVAGIALAAGLLRNDIHWGPQTVLLLGVALVCGTAIFAGLFVCAASLQFFLVNGADLTSSFTYGCSYATSQPASIVPTPLRIVFGQLVPVAFTAYLRTLAILHLPARRCCRRGPSGARRWPWPGCGGGNVLVAMGNPALPGRRRLDVVSRIYLSRR